MEIFLVVAIVLLTLIILAKSLLVVQENQRVVVIKLGKVERVFGPGLCLLIPFVDIPVLVNLDAHIPAWANLSQEALNEELKTLVRQNPNPKFYR